MRAKSNVQLFAVLFPSFIFLMVVVFIEFEPPNKCVEHSVSSRGHGSKVKQFAELNAIRHWEDQASNIHTDLSGWHRAQEKHMTCRLVGGDTYYYCRAFAKPCLSTLAANQKMDINKLGPKSDFPMFKRLR